MCDAIHDAFTDLTGRPQIPCEIIAAPTATASPTATMTPIFTFTATSTPEGTATETPLPTSTLAPIDTETPLATATFTAVATFTATSEPEGTATESPTLTPIATSTATSEPEGTATETPAPAGTPTFTPIFTATSTSTPEGTATETPEPVETPTFTPIFTATTTSTPDGTATETPTPDVNARRFRARLVGANEVPPVDTDARGRALFKLRTSASQLRYRVFVRDIDGVTMAHIHCGAAGVNGPVVAFLFGPDPDGFDPRGRRLAAGSVIPANLIPVPDSAACPGGIANFDELIAKIRAGQTYTNVHTLDHPAGEIRGQNEIRTP